MATHRIAARLLAELVSQRYCPRCFWLKMKMEGKLPFQAFPGIFSSFDAFQKKLTAEHWHKQQSMPSWLKCFGQISELVPVAHWSQFRATDEISGLEIRGVPDLIFRLADNSFGIVDYKTSRLTDAQHAQQSLYSVQLNAYGWIAQRCGYYPITKLGLVYFDPQIDLGDDLVTAINENGFDLFFEAKPVPLAVDMDSIPPLMQKAADIAQLQHPPQGKEGCKDCELVEKMGQFVIPSPD